MSESWIRKLDLSNYATKVDLKNATGVDTSKFTKKIDLSNLKSNAKILILINWKMYQLI